MKKLLTLTFIIAAVLISSKGYSQAYKNGDKLLNLGIGLGTYGYGGLGFGGSFEVGVTDDISVGPLVGYSGTTSFGANFSVFTIGGRGSYHLNNLIKLDNDKVDLYAGLGLGYRNIKWDYNGLGGDNYGSGVLLLAHVGGRYYFTDKVAGFAELGSGFGTLQLGVAFKF